MFIEDDDLAVEEVASAIQTRCLGRKQSTACWLPELRPDVAADAGVVCAGTWDEAENELALWSVVLRGGPTGGGAEMEVEGGGAPPEPQRLCGAAHGGGDVLGLCAAAPAGGGATCVFSASSGGDVRCHAVQWAGSAAALHPLWTAASSGCLHGVSWDADGQELAAAGDAGELLVLDASGATRATLQAREAALLGVCWARPKEVFTVGSRLLQWDVRTRAPPVALAAEPNKGPHEAPQLQCVASHPQKPQIVAAGSSEGAVYVWDVRAAAAPLATVRAHASDVWAVQLRESAYGGLLSCSSDGSVVVSPVDGAADGARPAPIVQSHLPVNAIDLSPRGWLVAASDAEALTFVDRQR